MTGSIGPMDRAYQALAQGLETALREAGVLTATQDLIVDPEAPMELFGTEEDTVTAAGLMRVSTGAVAFQMGGINGAIYTVERRCRLEVGIAGPMSDAAGADLRGARKQTLELGLAACAQLASGRAPTLGEACERLELGDREDGDMNANGLFAALEFVLRVRSGDRLGLTESY